MTHKQRVLAAIKGELVDRIPRFLWIGPAAAEKLCAFYGVPADRLNERVDNDILQAWLSINREMERELEEGETFVDEWGITWKREGYYNMVIRHPLGGLEVDEIRRYPVPPLFAPDRFLALDALLETYGAQYWIGADVSGTIFEPAYHLRGLEELMMDMASQAEEADVILDMTANQSLAIALEAVRRGADWIWLGDDMGSQANMMISPELWRKYFKPRMKRIIEAVREERPDIIIAYHSCGSIRRILPELIELGIDVINPLQQSAADMNHDEIRALFGTKTTMFCGLDTQTMMVHADVDEIRRETHSLLHRLGANGHFICGVSHTLQPDVPTENIAAMIDALDRFSEQMT